MPLITLSGLGKTYPGGVCALECLDLSIEAGEFVSIVGPSGSGKSTLMNILGLLDRPSAGRYLLYGRDTAECTPRELSRLRGETLGFIFQSFCLLEALTARENVELPLRYRGLPAQKRRRLALDALAQVGLSEREAHLPGQLSGGQQQRVAIARALVTRPALLLADEPTGNLDAEAAAVVMALLTRLACAGQTLVIITHDPAVAAQSRRRIHMAGGRIEEDIRHADPAPIRHIPPKAAPPDA